MKRLIPLVLLAAVGGAYWYTNRPPTELVLTGIVTTREVIVSPQIQGRIDQLLVDEGDKVERGQMLALLAPDELREERAFASFNAEGAGAQVEENQAELRWEEKQSLDQITRAEANVAAAEAKQQAVDAELSKAKADDDRAQKMWKDSITTLQAVEAARSAVEVARAQASAQARQVESERAALALARANRDQVLVRRSRVDASRKQQSAANAQRSIADVRLAYTEIKAPLSGTVDTRAAREGEVVTPGSPILTIIDPDNLWVRADVEETYIDRVKSGDVLKVRLPSGEVRDGTVFYRAADAGFATQRDVSRTKRDIKTFEIRLKMDNADRRLAVGMTAYVLLPVAKL